jgi:hypothetical protein
MIFSPFSPVHPKAIALNFLVCSVIAFSVGRRSIEDAP